jgi:hypothetical protein
MTIIHKGIVRDVSDVDNDYGRAFYVQNVSFRRLGEIGRRPGFGKSTMAKLDGPVVLMAAGSFDEPYIIQITDTGTVVATRDPSAYWGSPTMRPPTRVPASCAMYSRSAGGVDDDTVGFSLPSNACAAVLTMTGQDAGGRSGDYGYTFTVTEDGALVYTSSCVVNDSVMTNISAGASTVVVSIVGGCAGVGDPGSWSLSLSS